MTPTHPDRHPTTEWLQEHLDGKVERLRKLTKIMEHPTDKEIEEYYPQLDFLRRNIIKMLLDPTYGVRLQQLPLPHHGQPFDKSESTDF